MMGPRQLLRRYSTRKLEQASRSLDDQLCRPGDFWLFVLGVNNSGTTLLTKLLEAHPGIRSLPAEGQLLTDAFPRPDKLGVERLWTARMDLFRWTEDDDVAPAVQAKRDWLTHYPDRSGILLEKSPPNTVRSRWLQRHFQPSRFLAITRHPYAVCEGIRRRKQYAMEQAATHWVNANRCLLDDMASLERVLMIRYEDLVTEPAACLGQVEAFLGLEGGHLLESTATVESHSLEGSTAGLTDLNASSLERLSREDIDVINDICGPLMNDMGYERL